MPLLSLIWPDVCTIESDSVNSGSMFRGAAIYPY
jgi:hypothetical protein